MLNHNNCFDHKAAAYNYFIQFSLFPITWECFSSNYLQTLEHNERIFVDILKIISRAQLLQNESFQLEHQFSVDVQQMLQHPNGKR